MKVASIAVLALGLVLLFFQNCSSESGTGLFSSVSSDAKPNLPLDMVYRFKSMNVLQGTKSITLDGQCSAQNFAQNRIIWQANINGQVAGATVENACNTFNGFFFFNVDLGAFNLAVGSNFIIVATIVGVDSNGRLTSGPSTSVEIIIQSSGSNPGGTDPGGGGSGNTPFTCTPGSSSRIDSLQQAQGISPNAPVADFAETSQITNVTLSSSGEICVHHSKAGQWPVEDPFGDGTDIEGNYWFVSYKSGSWYVWPYEWYRPGQACKTVSMTRTGEDSGVGRATTPVSNWTPCKGALVGVVASTPGRIGAVGIQERSDIYWINWP